MTKRLRKQTLQTLLERLSARYGGAECALTHKNVFELLAATILSAQCTDKRVNMVTPALFAAYPTPFALAQASQEAVEDLVRTTGFFRNKAKNLIAMAQRLVSEHGGEVPKDFAALVRLPGVARKTANVVMGTGFGVASGVVVDTHVGRITQLLGMTDYTDPVRIERDLIALLPPAVWIDFSHMLIHHGREVCIARRPRCSGCLLNDICPSARKSTSSKRVL